MAKALITAPVPTVQDAAREMGVGKARVQQLRQLMTAIAAGATGGVERLLSRTASVGAKRRVIAKRRVTKRRHS